MTLLLAGKALLKRVMFALPLLTAGGLAETVREVNVPLVELPPQAADLSIRFNHLVAVLNAPDLLAYWPFDEGSGYEFLDGSGNGHTAYITGSAWNTTDSGLTASFRRQGKRAGAVYLNGSQWLQVQAAPGLQHPGQLSVSVWVKLDEAPAGQVILANTDDRGGYLLSLGSERNVQFVVTGGGGDVRTVTSTVASEPDTVEEGAWLHVVATSDAGTGQGRLYLNGLLAASLEGEPFRLASSAQDLYLGHSPLEPTGLKGWLDEVAIHEGVLAPEDVKSLYALGFPKLYAQTRETIDADKEVWTRYRGNAPVPHPLEADTVFLATFNGTLTSLQGQPAETYTDSDDVFVPGAFGGAFDAVRHTDGLVYASPLGSGEGTVEAWFTPVQDSADPERHNKRVIFRAEGEEGWLELASGEGKWLATLGSGDRPSLSAEGPAQAFAYDVPVHLGVTWKAEGNAQELALFVNGVEVARQLGQASGPASVFDRNLLVGGRGAEAAHGYLDDLRVSSTVRGWGSILPRGHRDSESPPLDLMDSFDHDAGEALMLWRSGSQGSDWGYAIKRWEDDGGILGDSGLSRRSLKQRAAQGRHTLYHPDAYGGMSSLEAGVSFEEVADGWAGVFTGSPAAPGEGFSGHTFTLNPAANSMRLEAVRDGEVVASKVLPYDFTLQAETTYTLTLTATNDGVLRGYLDGHNLISLALTGDATSGQGFAGLLTENTAAHFDDVHFTALTPATAESRLIQQRLFADAQMPGATIGYEDLSLSAFRWKKRYGLLPWQRTFRDPQPPGSIFGADDGVERPNPPAFWRSNDSGVSQVLKVDGTIYKVMRGNPHIRGISGVALIGTVIADAATFDGIHFEDQNAGVTDLDEGNLLQGHPDPAPAYAKDTPPRDQRFQVNDQGCSYLNGKILCVAREFRNTRSSYPWFRRLVFGIYDVASQRWETPEVKTVAWSSQTDPADPFSEFAGLDATPEITALRDPQTDDYAIFLYHVWRTEAGVPTTGVTGLRLEGEDLVLHDAYPTRSTYTKPDGDAIYGERISYDNGIYYMHYNAGSDPSKLRMDWPDRLHLASSLHPYEGPWTTSADNENPDRPYFARGDEYDLDNAAIWSGYIFKDRNRYYLYYELYHSLRNVNQPYEFYNNLQTGSRVGYATGN